MKKVVILASERCVLSTIASPMDMFMQVGVLWNLTMGKDPEPFFDVKIVTADGQPVMAINQVPVIPAAAMHDVHQADLVVIPSQGLFFDPESRAHGDRVAWLRECYEAGSELASVCTGAFTLAATGLLDGKTATTHWGMARQFRKQFPAVRLQIDRMVTDEGRLFCGGGITADLNLSLYLIQRYCGREVALQSARFTLVELDRLTQAPFAVFNPEKDHRDYEVLGAQDWMEANYAQDVDPEALAASAGMSLRQFNRRFRSATGETVNRYLQLLRVEAAKRQLIASQNPFEEIAKSTGYENISYFRRVFKKATGVTPKEYRRRFADR